jgi:hypothetical protein
MFRMPAFRDFFRNRSPENIRITMNIPGGNRKGVINFLKANMHHLVLNL